MNNEFTERATTDICFTLQFSLMTNQCMCVKRLYQLVVDIKSKQESKGKIVIASQILWQLLQIPEYDPGKVCFIPILCGLLSQQIKGQYSGKDIIFFGPVVVSYVQCLRSSYCTVVIECAA